MQISIGIFQWLSSLTPEDYQMSDGTKDRFRAAIRNELNIAGRLLVADVKVNHLVDTCVKEIEFFNNYQLMKSKTVEAEQTQPQQHNTGIPPLSYRRSMQYYFYAKL